MRFAKSQVAHHSGERAHSSTKTEAGIALIIVMISIFVLTMLAGGFAYSMKVETKLARNANNEGQIEWLGRSALEKARYILAEQLKIAQEPYDGLDQVWAGGSGGIGTSNSPLANIELKLDTADGGHADFSIIDLERKININVVNEGLLQQALTVVGLNAGDSTPLVNSILDWIDPDDKPRIQGAESDFYQSYWPEHPYSAKNGPVDNLSELLLIRGVTPELFWGTDSTNYQQYALPQNRRDAAPAFVVGLTNLFTPLSTGRININTASAEVLQVLPGVTPEIAQGIVSARSGEADPMGLSGPYRNVDQVRRVPEVNIMAAQMIRQFCDVRSSTFEVHIDAQVSGYHRHFVGTLGRSPRGVDVLNFYWVN